MSISPVLPAQGARIMSIRWAVGPRAGQHHEHQPGLRPVQYPEPRSRFRAAKTGRCCVIRLGVCRLRTVRFGGALNTLVELSTFLAGLGRDDDSRFKDCVNAFPFWVRICFLSWTRLA